MALDPARVRAYRLLWVMSRRRAPHTLEGAGFTVDLPATSRRPQGTACGGGVNRPTERGDMLNRRLIAGADD